MSASAAAAIENMTVENVSVCSTAASAKQTAATIGIHSGMGLGERAMPPRYRRRAQWPGALRRVSAEARRCGGGS